MFMISIECHLLHTGEGGIIINKSIAEGYKLEFVNQFMENLVYNVCYVRL